MLRAFERWMTDVDNDLWGSVVAVALGFAASAVIVLIAYALDRVL